MVHRPPPESAKREQIKQQVAGYVRESGDTDSPEPVVEFVTETYDEGLIQEAFEEFESDLRGESGADGDRLDEVKDELGLA